MAQAGRSSRNNPLHTPITLIFYLSALMMLLDVATTAIGLRMGGYESNFISAAIIHYDGLAGFELVKIPGVVMLVAASILVGLRWSAIHPLGRHAFAAVAFFCLFLTAAPVAHNLLEILPRL